MSRWTLGIGVTLHALSLLLALAVLLPMALVYVVTVLPVQFLVACWREAEYEIYESGR